MKKLLVLTLVLVGVFVVIGPGAAQESGQKQGPPPQMPCPFPMIISSTATGKTSPYTADFPGPVPPLADFGGSEINKHVRHTFTWNPTGNCCQYGKGTLTLKYKAISNADNDAVAIYVDGVAKASVALYPNPSGVKVIPLTPEMLVNNRLSFRVQDDTSVISAKLDLVACCVKK